MRSLGLIAIVAALGFLLYLSVTSGEKAINAGPRDAREVSRQASQEGVDLSPTYGGVIRGAVGMRDAVQVDGILRELEVEWLAQGRPLTAREVRETVASSGLASSVSTNPRSEAALVLRYRQPRVVLCQNLPSEREATWICHGENLRTRARVRASGSSFRVASEATFVLLG
jgi:hypothetical protein